MYLLPTLSTSSKGFLRFKGEKRMAILKHHKPLTDNFTITPNETFQNPNLSYEAKGLLIELLTRPSNWVIRKNQLIRDHTRGTKLQRIINELKESGNLFLCTSRDKKNKITGKDWIVSAYQTTKDDFLKSIDEQNKSTKKQGKNDDELVTGKPCHRESLSQGNMGTYKEKINTNKELLKSKKDIFSFENALSMFPPVFRNDKNLQTSWKEWWEFKRTEKKKSISRTAINKLINSLNGHQPIDLINAIDLSIQNDWSGLFLSSPIKKPSGMQRTTQPDPSKETEELILEYFPELIDPDIKHLNQSCSNVQEWWDVYMPTEYAFMESLHPETLIKRYSQELKQYTNGQPPMPMFKTDHKQFKKLIKQIQNRQGVSFAI